MFGDHFLARDDKAYRKFTSLLWAEIMRLLLLITINLHVSQVYSRKHISSSDESIENLLYYKDCSHKAKEPPPVPIARSLPPPPKPPDCPFPKMCCSMSCGNECGNQQSFFSRPMEPIQNLPPMPSPNQPRQPEIQLPVQPQIMRGRKKKTKMPMDMQLPLGARRGLGLTKEKIKNLISQDNDIRKILKDLVRVTMQKVDLLEMIKSRRSGTTVNNRNSEESLNSDEYDSYMD